MIGSIEGERVEEKEGSDGGRGALARARGRGFCLLVLLQFLRVWGLGLTDSGLGLGFRVWN